MKGTEDRAGPPYGLAPAVSIRRFVNDEIGRVAARWGDEGAEFEFICECGELSCRRFLTMPLADYRASSPGSVIGHGEPG